MIDLDVRLETSLGEDDYGYLARKQNKELPKGYEKKLVFTTSNKQAYDKARELALSLLQDEESISYAVMSLVHRLYNQGYIYIELAVSPYLHSRNGLNLRKIFNAVLSGLDDAINKCPGMDANVIMYCSKEAPNDFNKEVVAKCLEYREERVVAVGLEGEGRPVSSYSKLFEPAKKENYPVVVELSDTYNSHANIINAVKLGAKRIISPYKFNIDPNLLPYFGSEGGVHFEYRPSLDVILGRLNSMEELPIKYLWQYGFNCYVAGSSYQIADASLKKEFIHLGQRGFMREDVQRSIYVSIQAAFVRNIRERNRILKKFVEYFPRFYNKTI